MLYLHVHKERNKYCMYAKLAPLYCTYMYIKKGTNMYAKLASFYCTCIQARIRFIVQYTVLHLAHFSPSARIQ